MNSFIKREYDYAIRICAYLAGRMNTDPVPLPYMARVLQITKPFTTKIVYQLKKAGITSSVQGKTGGILLNKNPKQLSLFTILQGMGFNSTLNECVLDEHRCPLISICHIHNFFVDTEIELLMKLKNKMISELVIKEQDLPEGLL